MKAQDLKGSKKKEEEKTLTTLLSQYQNNSRI